MKHYFVTKYRNRPNASSKAVVDADAILDEAGYKPLTIMRETPFRKYLGPLFAYFYRLRLARILKRGKSDDVFFVQWPMHPIGRHGTVALLKRYQPRIQLLIHDLDCLRYHVEQNADEAFLLRSASLIVVHTPAMKHYLAGMGIAEERMKVLETFDYLTDDAPIRERAKAPIVTFAGNLRKSAFLQRLDELPNLTFFCYGKGRSHLCKSDNVKYKGVFSPNCVSALEGSWGLVWDGGSLDGCEGEFGAYLQYNAPHKVSLYIVAGLPLIVWSKSGVAPYVTSKGLGIAVDSLHDIGKAISSLSDAQYAEILQNLCREAIALKTGSHLTKAIECV